MDAVQSHVVAAGELFCTRGVARHRHSMWAMTSILRVQLRIMAWEAKCDQAGCSRGASSRALFPTGV